MIHDIDFDDATRWSHKKMSRRFIVLPSLIKSFALQTATFSTCCKAIFVVLPFSLSRSPVPAVPKDSTLVSLNLRALMCASNRMSISAYDRPLGSGRRKYVHIAHRAPDAAQKKPALAPQCQDVGLSMWGVRTLATTPVMLYRFRARTTVLLRRRVEEISATSE